MKFDDRSPKRVAPLLSPSIGREKGSGVEGGSWLLRWNPGTQPRPEVLLPQEPRSDFPAHLHTGRAGFVLFEGYLFDKMDFLSDPDATAAACVAQAYEHYGEGVFDHLRGGYALAIWDQERARLLVGRDAIGLHPCYYYWDGHLFLLSPDLDLILAQPEVNGDFNRVILAEYLSDIWHDHQRQATFYQQVNRLLPAHQISLQGSRLELHRYWDPLPPGFEWAGEEQLGTFYPMIERAVARCLQIGADSISLSGGFDSVSIAVLAAGQSQGRSPLHALSLHFDIAGSDEWATQSAVARRLGMPQIVHTVSEFVRQERVVSDTLDILSTCPLPVSGLLQSIYRGLFASALQHGLSKLLLGNGGDEMFYLDISYAADCLASLNLPALWRYYRAMANASVTHPLFIARNIFWRYSAKTLLVEMLRSTLESLAPDLAESLRRRHLALDPWLATSDPALRETLVNRRMHPPEVEISPGEGRYARAIRGLLQSPYVLAHTEQSFCWTAQLGVNLLYPYYDRDLVELSVRMPPEYLISGGRTKSPLRRLVAERLPAVTLKTKKVDFTPTYNAILRQQGLPLWREWGGPVMLSDLGLVEAELLTPIIEGYFAGRNNQLHLTYQVMSAESWLRARAN